MAKALANSYLAQRKKRHSIDSSKIKWTQTITETNSDLLMASTEIENALISVLQSLDSTTKDYPQEIKKSLDDLFGETNSPLKILKIPKSSEECKNLEAVTADSILVLETTVFLMWPLGLNFFINLTV